MPPELIGVLVFLIGFPLMAFGIWKLVMTIISAGLGWGRVAARFPDRPDEVLATYTLESAIMGAGVRLTNCLTITACRTGLRVERLRMFAGKEPAFLVPWREMHVTRGRLPLEAIAIIRLGSPAVNTMKISAALADKLAALVPDQWPEHAAARQAPPIVS